MITTTYKLTDYPDFLLHLAGVFGTAVQDSTLPVPETVGSGFFKAAALEQGVSALLYSATLKEMLVCRRKRDDHEYYILVFDWLEREHGFRVMIDTDESSGAVERPVVFYLTSYLYDVESVLYENVNIKGVRIMLSVSWMQRYLQLKENEEVLEKYIALKAAGIWYKPVNDELLTLLNDLVTGGGMPRLFFENKIFRIIELFFEWLYNEMKVLPDTAGISRRDIETAQQIEALLTQDVTKLPPTIKELARDAAMSESKLKKVFKGVYGQPPYEYYQHQRMNKARLMLLSGDYSVKDIGYTLGYANLSNFTLAFKKVFGKVPSQLLPK